MDSNILLVEDDDDFAEQITLELERAGYTVARVETAAAATAALTESQPDLAIFDLMLEEVDSGFSLCYQTKKRYPDLPVIMVSGVAGETGMAFDVGTDDERNWLQADSFLNKPLRFEQLRQEIERLLGKG